MYDLNPLSHPHFPQLCEVGNSSHGKDVTPQLPVHLRGLQLLRLEGAERPLPCFIEALGGEVRAMTSQLTKLGLEPRSPCSAHVAPLSTVLSVVGPRAPERGQGVLGQWREHRQLVVFELGTWCWLFQLILQQLEVGRCCPIFRRGY